jgi:hypothetical protein
VPETLAEADYTIRGDHGPALGIKDTHCYHGASLGAGISIELSGPAEILDFDCGCLLTSTGAAWSEVMK